MVLTGRVEAGLGRAGRNVGLSSERLAKVLGRAPYPGTLNVKLSRPFVAPHGATPVVVPGLGARDIPFWLYPARMQGVDVWVARSLSQVEVTDDLLEVISAVSLRQHLGLHDGDLVSLEFVVPPTPVRVEQDVAWLPRPNHVDLVLSSALPPAGLVTSAFVLAFSGQDLLLVQHARRGWQVPGGHVEPGESPMAAARRECLEEAAAQVVELWLVGYDRIHISAPQPPGYGYPYPDSYQVFFAGTVETMFGFSPTLETLKRRLASPGDAGDTAWVQQYRELVEAARKLVGGRA